MNDIFRQPTIIGFLCNWCAYEGADAAGRARAEVPSTLHVVRVMCSGQVAPQWILDAFGKGADGVMVLGCPHGDCHYKNGNVLAFKRKALIQRVLASFGIEPARFRMDWIGARDWRGLVDSVSCMTEDLARLGGHPQMPASGIRSDGR